MHASRPVISMLAIVVCALAGCGDSGASDDDGGMDAATALDSGAPAIDAGHDGGATLIDAGPPPDAGPIDQCLAYAANLRPPDADRGLGQIISVAIRECVRGPCVDCAQARGMGTACGAGGTLSSCVLDCFENNDFGGCPAANCDTGQTCDTSGVQFVCRSNAIRMVNNALAAGDVDLGCLSCFIGIPQCVAANNCMCGTAGCACDRCQCDHGCPNAFAACSGLPPVLDCAAVADMCAMP